jgi:SAM-dependent methyltransferase
MPDLDPRCADDVTFDTVYPAAIRLLSRRFWTPVEVARRAAAMFEKAAARRVLDVGSGVGKFAICAAAAAPGVEFVGVEQRPNLLGIARSVGRRFGLRNVRFQLGDATEVPWSAFDGFYFFNPFVENLFDVDDAIDSGVELSQARFMYEVLRVETSLQTCPLGTVLVTYYGSGTRIPGGFTLVTSERAGRDWLRLWVKRSDATADTYFTEGDDGTVLQKSAARGSLKTETRT